MRCESELWFTASDELLGRLADRGGMNAGLNPAEDTEDEELAEMVWRALQSVELAGASGRSDGRVAKRPTPAATACSMSEQLRCSRGRHKVFLGMAVGVGKTCRMLQEGHSVAAGGKDVAIGLLETHGRPETAALAEGLELIPRRSVPCRGRSSTRWTCPRSCAARRRSA